MDWVITAPYGPPELKTVIAADEICATSDNNQRYGPDFGFENLMEERESRPPVGILAILPQNPWAANRKIRARGPGHSLKPCLVVPFEGARGPDSRAAP